MITFQIVVTAVRRNSDLLAWFDDTPIWVGAIALVGVVVVGRAVLDRAGDRERAPDP